MRLLLRFLKICPVLALPWLCLAADDSRPACNSENDGRMWPEAANHDPQLLARLVRCGDLLICVRGTWHYRWEAPTVRVDQLARHAKSKASKPAVCEVPSVVQASGPDQAAANEN
jgi:hypothetical protein